MKFLCLHGVGTSNQIFEMQTDVIRRELGPKHSFHFVEGTIKHPPGAGIDAFASMTDEFFAYHLEDTSSTVCAALDQLETYLETEGPFEGVMAFSQGAGLAAMLMIRRRWQAEKEGSKIAPFKCAVFFSGEPPADPGLLERGEVRIMDFAKDGIEITVPTAHIWGTNDTIYPTFGPILSELCSANNKNVVLHNGGHEVPGPKSQKAVTEAVKAIRRTIALASA